MKKTIITICFPLIFLLLLNSCNKYKNDEILGEWDIESYKVNDYDSTFFIDQFDRSTLLFSDSESDHVVLQCVKSSDFIVLEYSWDLKKRNTHLILVFKSQYNQGIENWFESGPFIKNAYSDWKINHLSDNYFQIECSIDGNNYKLNLTK